MEAFFTDHGHPNWLLRIFIGFSAVVHIFIILYGSDLYHPGIIIPMEITIRFSEPPKQIIPSPPVQPQLPVAPEPVSRVMVRPAPVKPVRVVKTAPRLPLPPKVRKDVIPPKPEPTHVPDQTASESVPEKVLKTDLSATMASIGAKPENVPEKISKSPAASVVEGAPDVRKNYLRTIRQLIERQKKYPQVARLRQFQGKVVVEFELTPSGHVSTIIVVESCRFGILNRAAIQAIEDASPFPKPPDSLINNGFFLLRIPIVFELT